MKQNIKIRTFLNTITLLIIFFCGGFIFCAVAPVHAGSVPPANPSAPVCQDQRSKAHGGPRDGTTIPGQADPCPQSSQLQNGHCYMIDSYTTGGISALEITCGGDGFPVNGATTIIISAPPAPTAPTTPAGSTTGSAELDGWLKDIINLLSGVVGLVIVISLIVAGIQYMTAGDNSSQVAAAKNRIAMAILAFILFAFAFVLLQWLVPGGIF